MTFQTISYLLLVLWVFIIGIKIRHCLRFTSSTLIIIIHDFYTPTVLVLYIVNVQIVKLYCQPDFTFWFSHHFRILSLLLSPQYHRHYPGLMQMCWKLHPPKGKLLPLHPPYRRSRTCLLQIRWSAWRCRACGCYELGTESKWLHYDPPGDDWLVQVGNRCCKDHQMYLVDCFSHLLFLFHCQFDNVEGTCWGEFHIWRKNMGLVGVWLSVSGYW